MLLTLTMCFSLIGCSNKEKDSNLTPEPTSSNVETSEEVSIPEPEPAPAPDIEAFQDTAYISLEEYYNNEEKIASLENDIEELLARYSDIYQDININITDNTFSYIYIFKDPKTEEDAKTIEANLCAVEDNDLLLIRDDIVGDSNITDTIYVRYIYLQPDETLLTEFTFEIP